MTKVDPAALSPVLDYIECSQYDIVNWGLQLKLELASYRMRLFSWVSLHATNWPFCHVPMFHRDPSSVWFSVITALSRRWTHSQITNIVRGGRVKTTPGNLVSDCDWVWDRHRVAHVWCGETIRLSPVPADVDSYLARVTDSGLTHQASVTWSWHHHPGDLLMRLTSPDGGHWPSLMSGVSVHSSWVSAL